LIILWLQVVEVVAVITAVVEGLVGIELEPDYLLLLALVTQLLLVAVVPQAVEAQIIQLLVLILSLAP
jgi:hypothetical protein